MHFETQEAYPLKKSDYTVSLPVFKEKRVRKNAK
jgi:hypothetical protein